jgi:hypothetical protein
MLKMKVVVDIPRRLLDQIGETVDVRSYNDTREFVSVALENQVELELTGSTDAGVMTIEDAVAGGDSSSHQEEITPNSKLKQSDSSTDGLLQQGDYNNIPAVSSPKEARLDDGPLWGQYNRIFPVKLTVRALANQMRNLIEAGAEDGGDKQWVSLKQFSESAAEVGREYGLKIQQEDEAHSRGQGEKLSAALPIGDNPEKSKERFQTHFVGYAEQGGDLTGAAPHLLFVNIPEDSPGMIGITEAGLEFAELWNPLLDGDLGADKPLSNDEATFYLKHVKDQLPTEYEAMALTAEAIEDGDNRPDSLSARVASLNNDWSEAQANTIRSGLVSRMYELGLVQRERVGQRGVAYRLTNEEQEVFNHE